MGKRINLQEVPRVSGSGYPRAIRPPCAARIRQRLGDAAGLSDFGVNLMRLAARSMVQPAALAFGGR